MEGRQLGRYKLIEEIGQGGMAVVWRGVDTLLQREVAVKILHPHLSRKESNRQRFAREARVVATLHHDNIVEIYDFSGGQPEGAVTGDDAYIVCEYIRGRTLADFIEATPRIPVETSALIVIEICEAVAHAHSLGVVHRDIKPENVMIRQDGVLKLMDFGIARVADDSGATMTGTLMGSPHFMSPEQVAGSELDARSDLFSIGVLLYRLVTGAFPFEGPNPAAILRSILESTPVPPDQRNPLVGRALAATIRRALAKSPEERHESVRALRDDLVAAIADAGLGSPRDELQRFFADAEGYSCALTPLLVTRFAAAGHERAARRDIAGAMELYSRVLELDPQNESVRSALDTLSRSRRSGRAVRYALGAFIGIALLGAAATREWQSWKSRATQTPAAIATGASRDTTPVVEASTVATNSAPIAAPSLVLPVLSRTRLRPKIAVIATPTPVGTTLAMAVPAPSAAVVPTSTPLPPGKGAISIALATSAEVFIDETYIGNARDKGMIDRPIPLAPGDHRVRIAPNQVQLQFGCKVLDGTVTIAPGQVEHSIRVGGDVLDRERIYLRGCQIEFKIDAGAATEAIQEVRVDGKPVAMNKDTGAWRSTSGQHTLSVVAAGFAPYEKQIELRPREDFTGKGPPVESVELRRP